MQHQRLAQAVTDAARDGFTVVPALVRDVADAHGMERDLADVLRGEESLHLGEVGLQAARKRPASRPKRCGRENSMADRAEGGETWDAAATPRRGTGTALR